MEICIECGRELEEGEDELCPACRSEAAYEENILAMKISLYNIPIIGPYIVGKEYINLYKKRRNEFKKGRK